MNFSTYVKGIAGAFAVSWVGLVALPWFEIGNLPPLTGEGNVIIPWDSPNLAHAGEAVYASQGCVYCHTQQVRDGSSGADFVRGWAKCPNVDPDAPPAEKIVERRSYPRDYIWQQRVFLGNSRAGSDLSNIGARYDVQPPPPDLPSATVQMYLELYDPYIKAPYCAMPAYKYLFITRRITGQPSTEALPLTGDDAPAPGYEVVPTRQAKALVAYLLSLRKGYHLPADEVQGPASN